MVDEQFTPESGADLFEVAVAAARREKVDDELVRRVEQHAIALANKQGVEPASVVQPESRIVAPARSFLPRPIARRVVWCAAMAAGLLLAFMVLGRGRAWAEVVRAVAAEKWMRLTLQIPDELPDGVPEEVRADPEFKIWISGDRTRIAKQDPWETRWDDLASQETWRFNKKTGRLRLSKTEGEDRADMQFFAQLLDQLKARKKLRGRIRGELIDSSREDVVVEGKQFTDFRFVYRYQNSQPPKEEMIVRVDSETKRPTQLVSQREGAKHPPRVFLIDYPDVGPEDVYALGVPDDAPLDDVQSLARFFPPKKPKNVADYEMIEVEFAGSSKRKFLAFAYRYRKRGDQITKEVADPEKVVELASKAHGSKRGLPTNEEELRWFTDQIREYKFGPIGLSVTDYPHVLCYPSFSRVDDYEWTTQSTTTGLEECFVVGGPKRWLWFDPTRDMIVRRWESVKGDKNLARCCQEVIQGPNGNWLPTLWAVSRVDKPGGKLVKPVQHVCEYKFDE